MGRSSIEAENTDLKEQVKVLEKRLSCIIDNSTLHSKSSGPTMFSVDGASQCDIDTTNFHLQLSVIGQENERLQKELSLHITTINEKENENVSLRSKNLQLEEELKMIKSRDSVTWENFEKLYPKDSFTCLTKRMETELYFKNTEIKELFARNVELKNEISSLQSIIKMQQCEMGGVSDYIGHDKMCCNCFPPLTPNRSDNRSSTSTLHHSKNIVVHPDIHYTLSGMKVLPHKNQPFHPVKSKNRQNQPMKQVSYDEIVCENRFEALPSDSVEEAEIPVVSRFAQSVGRIGKLNSRSRQKRLLLASDSHGKGLVGIIQERLQNYDVMVACSPGATFDYVANNLESLTSDFGSEDIAMLLAGTNDVDNTRDSRCNQQFSLKPVHNIAGRTNVKLINIPFRFDRPEYNFPIHCINSTLHSNIKDYNSISFVQTMQLSRECFTRHGLHLNKSGKRKLADIIIKSVNETIPQLTNGITLNDAPFLSEKCHKNFPIPNRTLLDADYPHHGRKQTIPKVPGEEFHHLNTPQSGIGVQDGTVNQGVMSQDSHSSFMDSILDNTLNVQSIMESPSNVFSSNLLNSAAPLNLSLANTKNPC